MLEIGIGIIQPVTTNLINYELTKHASQWNRNWYISESNIFWFSTNWRRIISSHSHKLVMISVISLIIIRHRLYRWCNREITYHVTTTTSLAPDELLLHAHRASGRVYESLLTLEDFSNRFCSWSPQVHWLRLRFNLALSSDHILPRSQVVLFV